MEKHGYMGRLFASVWYTFEEYETYYKNNTKVFYDTGCTAHVLWTGMTHGGGVLYFNSLPLTPRQFSYYLAYGDFDDEGERIKKTCRRLHCIHPDHLEKVSRYK